MGHWAIRRLGLIREISAIRGSLLKLDHGFRGLHGLQAQAAAAIPPNAGKSK